MITPCVSKRNSHRYRIPPLDICSLWCASCVWTRSSTQEVRFLEFVQSVTYSNDHDDSVMILWVRLYLQFLYSWKDNLCLWCGADCVQWILPLSPNLKKKYITYFPLAFSLLFCCSTDISEISKSTLKFSPYHYWILTMHILLLYAMVSTLTLTTIQDEKDQSHVLSSLIRLPG